MLEVRVRVPVIANFSGVCTQVGWRPAYFFFFLDVLKIEFASKDHGQLDNYF